MRRPGSIVHLKKQIRKVVYRLKWRYGFPVDIYRETLSEFDPRYGEQRADLSKIHIDRCIILPGSQHRDIFYSISFVKANSNFVTGGDIGLEDRTFIVDGRDLPANYEILDNDYFVWDNVRYSINKVEKLEADTGYYVETRRVINAAVRQIQDARILTKVVISSTFDKVD